MKTCCEMDCCGVGTVWDPISGICVSQTGGTGVVERPPSWEFSCRRQTCCESECCAPSEGTTYNGDCCQSSDVPLFIVKATFQIGPNDDNCPPGLQNLGTLVFNSQFGIDNMAFPMGDCENPVTLGEGGFFCPDVFNEAVIAFRQLPPGGNEVQLSSSFRFLNVTEVIDSKLCQFQASVTFEILCGAVKFSALPSNCNVGTKETPSCVCALNCIGDDCVADLNLQVDNAILRQDFGLCTAPGFLQRANELGMNIGP